MKYVKNANIINAVKYEGQIDNDIECLLDGCESFYYFDLDKLYIYDKYNRACLVKKGDFILKTIGGFLDIVPNNLFLKTYIQIGGNYENSV